MSRLPHSNRSIGGAHQIVSVIRDAEVKGTHKWTRPAVHPVKLDTGNVGGGEAAELEAILRAL